MFRASQNRARSDWQPECEQSRAVRNGLDWLGAREFAFPEMCGSAASAHLVNIAFGTLDDKEYVSTSLQSRRVDWLRRCR